MGSAVAFAAAPGLGAAYWVVPSAAVAQEEPSTEKVLRLESVRITGNERTRDKIILSHLGLKPGDPIDVDVLHAARQRLVATDYFSEVDLSTRPGSERGAVIVVVDVEERGFPVFETGFGYDDLYGWFVTLLGVRFDNTFGPESRLRLGWRFGFRVIGVDVQFDKPLTRRLSLGLAAYAYNQDQLFYSLTPAPPQSTQSEWRRFSQDISRVGAEIALSRELGRSALLSVGLSAQVADPDSSFRDRSADIDHGFSDMPSSLTDDIDKTNINGVFLRVFRDTRDHVAYPRHGSLSVLTVQANTSALGSDRDFVKGTLDLRKHFPIGTRTALSTRLNGGLTGRETPYYDRFYIGGVYSIRGFEQWSLSPTSGDDGFWLSSTELRFPLTFSGSGQPRVTGLLFLDFGQGWVWDQDIVLDDINVGTGYGVRIKLPWLGTLGVDAAVPLTTSPTDDPFEVYASLGFSF